MIEDTKMLISR